MIEELAGALADRGVAMKNGLLEWQCGCSAELMPRSPQRMIDIGVGVSDTGWIAYPCDEHKEIVKHEMRKETLGLSK